MSRNPLPPPRPERSRPPFGGAVEGPSVVEGPSATVLTLSKKAKGTPLAWRETDESIVITFEDGRKLTFTQALAPLDPPAGRVADALSAYRDPDPAPLSGAASPERSETKSKDPAAQSKAPTPRKRQKSASKSS